jgi:hypothetical protein
VDTEVHMDAGAGLLPPYVAVEQRRNPLQQGEQREKHELVAAQQHAGRLAQVFPQPFT